MHVIQSKRKLVLNTSHADDIARIIPHAKTVEHEGQKLVAVHHGVEECMVLKNMGLYPPAPIQSYYLWPGRVKPMVHQLETASFLTSTKRSLCLNSPGTGKSLASLWAADFLLEEGLAKKVLIVAPLSTLQTVWAKELRHHLGHRSFAVLTGTRDKRLDLLGTPGLQYAIINHDGFTTIHTHLQDFDVVIYDEATALKTPGSKRYKVFSKWVDAHKPWLWLLTGTPISQNPTDAWSLARLVNSPHIPKSYTAFKDRVMQKITTFKWVPRPDALEVCKLVLQPSVRFSLDECVDIPQTNYVGRFCELTPQQKRGFKQMSDDAVAIFGQDAVTAPNAAVVLGKLLQICCGVAYGKDGSRIAIDAAPRVDTLMELLDEIGVPDEKVIVFVPLRGVQDHLYTLMQDAGIDVATVHGDVSKKDRDSIFTNFQNSANISVLLAHPKVAAHGLTLTRAKHIIWYAPVYSLEQYEQANARIRRLNTVGKTTVWHVYSTNFEKELYRRLQHKRKVLGDFLNLVSGINEE